MATKTKLEKVATKVVSTEPKKAQAVQIAENAKLKNVFMPQTSLNKITAGTSTATQLANINKPQAGLNANTGVGLNASYSTPAGTNSGKSDVSNVEPTETFEPTPSKLEVKGNQAVIDTNTEILQGLGLPTGNVGTIQKIVNSMSEDTSEARIQKKKAQAALSALSSSGISYFENDPTAGMAESKWQDIEKAQRELAATQSSDKTALEEQIAMQNKADEFALAKSKEQGRAAAGGMTASMAQGREGVMSFTNPLVAKEFSKGIEDQIALSAEQLAVAENQRAKLLADLDKANQEDNEELAGAISENLAVVGNTINTIKEAAQKAATAKSAEALATLEKLSTITKNAGGGLFTDWTPADISSSLGIDIGTASLVKNIDTRMSALDTSDIDYATKVANLQKTQQEAIWAGMTPEQRNFAYASKLTGDAKDQFLNFAGKNPTYGFTTIGNKIFATNPLTGTVEQVAGGTTGGTRLTPSGVQSTAEINGKVVTLDRNALFALQTANGAAIDSGIGAINITSSTRDQKQTILTMAAKWGVEVDASSPASINQAAATLTAMGHSVAPVGGSNHETGLAIDIYPSDPASQSSSSAQAYIARVKPFLEANGWKQSTDPNDKGHFNYVGMNVYSDEQKAVMRSIDIAKGITHEQNLTLQDAGLSYADLATFKQSEGLTPEQKIAADNVKTKTQAALDAIADIETRELWKGAGRTALIPGVSYVSMTYNDLKADIDTIISNIALDEMKSLKEASKTGSTGFGAMNEKELTLLTSSKGTLRPEMSEELFKEKLDAIKEILLKVNGIDVQARREVSQITDTVLLQSVYNQIQTELNNGVSEEEIKAELEKNGYDSTQFFN